MNYEYLTFEENYPVVTVTEGSITILEDLLKNDPYESMSDDNLVMELIAELKKVSPHYAIGWLQGVLKDTLRSGVTRKDVINDIMYLTTREKD